jgi:hypothetical protein
MCCRWSGGSEAGIAMTRKARQALRRGWTGGTRAYLAIALFWLLLGFARCDKAGFNVGLSFGVPREVGSVLIAILVAGPIAFLVGGSVAFLGGLFRRSHEPPSPAVSPE